MSDAIDYTQYAVLYVDDEEQALKYFRKGLGKLFTVMTATNVDSALEMLKQDSAKIGVVITDQRMPGKQGTDLLAAVRNQWPGMVRILTTAYSEISSAIEAVNTGAVFKYLTKPVDLQHMRDTLMQAMDLFLAQQERDSLLQIKMSSLRQMVVADRVGSLTNLADGLTHHLRNSMTAMGCFLEEADPSNPSATPSPATGNDAPYAKQLWTLAAQERDELIKMLEQVQKSVMNPECEFGDETEVQPLIARAVEAAGVVPEQMVITAPADLPKLKADAEKAVQLLHILLAYVARRCSPGGKITIAAKGMTMRGDIAAVQIMVTGEGPAWTKEDVATFFTPFAFPKDDPSELGLGLLMAFSIAHQHGGDLLVHLNTPTGAGFELLLATNPVEVARPPLQENLLQTAFA
jgi:two-component system probable response regulator PhcQ